MARKTINVGGEIIELPEVPKKMVFIGVIAVLALIFVFTSFYTVDADEVGVIQRMGAYVRTTSPGLHFMIPFRVETVNKVKVRLVYK